jgi:HK97 family phage portal protein
MRILGFNITRAKAAPPVPVSENRGGWYRILESYSGAWQQNVSVDLTNVVSNPVVFACVTRIASDGSQMPASFEEMDADGVWTMRESPAFSPVLRKPNNYQNHIQFKESWFLSKLYRGNTYGLKARDNRNVVSQIFVLAPDRVKPMVADDGSVWYQLSSDNMAGGELIEPVMVPASEIIHDRYNCLFHPLVGLSPLFAAGVEAMKQLAVQNSSTYFFNNASRPGGILTAPGEISETTAERLKAAWETKFSGENAGKVAVLGDGLKFEAMTMTAEESQLIDQLKWGADAICAAFHMPPFVAGFGPLPANSSVESVMSMYYSLCLKQYVLAFEQCMSDGLGLGSGSRVQLDEEVLLRMDKSALYKTIAEGIRGGFLAPNEGRKMDNRKPIAGGDTVYLQQQNFSLEALAKRDAQDDPFGSGGTKEFETLKARFDAYGVGVRAGALTPQEMDEAAFREEAGFPPPSPAIDDVWKAEPVRRPITLKGFEDNPFPIDPDENPDADPAGADSAQEQGVSAEKAGIDAMTAHITEIERQVQEALSRADKVANDNEMERQAAAAIIELYKGLG